MGKVLTLGEILLRLSTSTDTRLSEANQLQVHYGGAEANVAISLANYNHEVSFASKVPDTTLGLAAKRHLQRYGVGTTLLRVGGDKLGCYYLEQGIGQRASTVLYDRAHSSFAAMKELDWLWDDLFDGVELFHVSGITPAVSDQWANGTLQIMSEAKRRKIKVSFDINYRANMWSRDKAKEVLAALLPLVDYCSAGKWDAVHFMGIEEKCNKTQDIAPYYQQMQDRYPNIKCFYSTIRQIQSTSHHALTGTIWKEGQLYTSHTYQINPIVDRVGGGDAFAAGVLHGLLTEKDMTYTVAFATAAAVLKHTIHGDCNPFLIREVESFMNNKNHEISR
jgi:2-dehydro-3-deoxygluconokinase